MHLKRTASIHWLTQPPSGQPRLHLGSGSITALPLTVDLEAAHPVATWAGDLFAGALAGIVALQLANDLVTRSLRARELTVNVSLEFDDESEEVADLLLQSVDCMVTYRGPGELREDLERSVEAALGICMAGLRMQPERLVVTPQVRMLGH